MIGWRAWCQNRGMARTYSLGVGRRVVNRVMTGLLTVGAGPASTYLLTTTGRRSGLPRTTPVTLVEDGTDRWLVAPYGVVPWVRNVRTNPNVVLRRGRDRQRLCATPVDPATAGPVLRQYARAVSVTRPYFDATPDDPDEAFAAEAAAHPVFRLTQPS